MSGTVKNWGILPFCAVLLFLAGDAAAHQLYAIQTARAEGGAVAGPVDMDRLAQLIDRSLERRLAPVVAAMNRIQKAQEKPDFRDVVGGIGYIVGIAGLGVVLRNRRS